MWIYYKKSETFLSEDELHSLIGKHKTYCEIENLKEKYLGEFKKEFVLKNYNHGIIFNPEMQLKWRKDGNKFHFVLIIDKDLPDWEGKLELKKLIEKRVYLWDASDKRIWANKDYISNGKKKYTLKVSYYESKKGYFIKFDGIKEEE